MIIKPRQLGREALKPDELTEDRKGCAKFGPCGIGEKAVYLNSFYIDRYYYLPVTSVRRMYKRVAMSKGGFSGRGMFASIPYLVVEYDDGREKQCIFKAEEQVDQMLAFFHERCPEIPVHSVKAEAWLAEKQQRLEEKKRKMEESPQREDILLLQEAEDVLEEQPVLYQELSSAARAKRVNEKSNPAYKWVALAIVLLGAASAAYGVYAAVTHADKALYFLLFGLAAIFLFSGANVLPTKRNNKAYIDARLKDAYAGMGALIDEYEYFPVPVHYAHPYVLRRMAEILADGRAKGIDQALEVLKSDLRAINSDVTVDQEEFEEIMAIKPLFLVRDYE